MTAGKRASTRLMAWAAWLLAIPPLWLFITTPMSVANQGLLGLASVVVIMLANRLRPDSSRICSTCRRYPAASTSYRAPKCAGLAAITGPAPGGT